MIRVPKNVVPVIVLLILLISAMAPPAAGIYFGKRIAMDIADN